MFSVPLGLWLGTPGLTVGLYVWKSVVPALLGNSVGGGLFCGTVLWFLYLQGQEAPLVDGDAWYGHGLEYDEEKGQHDEGCHHELPRKIGMGCCGRRS